MEPLFWRLFSNLLLAHLLTDFPLQPDFIFRQKKKGRLGVGLHAAVFLVVGALLLFPSLFRTSSIVLLIVLTGAHFWIDEAKLRLFRNSEMDNLWIFLADQAAHLLSLLIGAWAYVTLITDSIPPEDRFTLKGSSVIVLIGLIISSFVGVLIVHYLEKMFLGHRYKNGNLRPREKYYGILGRILVTMSFLAGRFWPQALIFSLLFLFFLTWRLKGWSMGFIVYFLTSASLGCLVGMFLLL